MAQKHTDPTDPNSDPQHCVPICIAFQDGCNATHKKFSVEKRGEHYLNEIKKLYENLTVRGEG
jgi:hypothetical protein